MSTLRCVTVRIASEFGLRIYAASPQLIPLKHMLD
jgi:hypothetical protein